MTKAKKQTTKYPGGAKIVDDGGEVTAYDRKGNYLGFTSEKCIAERMAQSGRVGMATIDEAGDISLWQFWNDAVDAGNRVMLADDGYQVISMGHSIFMRAKECATGWGR